MPAYNNTLQFHSEWPHNIKGVWMVYTNSTGGTHYFDFPGLDVQPDGPRFPAKGVAITSYTGKTDYWTVILLDAEGRLWGTEQGSALDIPHKSGKIEISFLATPGLPVQWATFTFPDGSSGKLAINRL